MDDTVSSLPVPAAGPDPGGSARGRRRRGLRVVLGALAAVVIVGVPVGTALFMGLARGTGDVVDRMVPNDADVYATLLLDPSLSQKRNIQGLLSHLPALHTQNDLQSKIDQGMDLALKPEGLSFGTDVRPWLGTQVAVALRLGDGTPTAVIIASKDDARAAATLARIRTTDAGRKDRWSERQHGGVAVSVGTPAAGGDGTPIAYAYVDHAAVVGNSASMIEAVIDTDQGRRPPLRSSAAYTATIQRLPSDRVALAYASGPGVTGAIRGALSGGGLLEPGLLRALDQGAGVFRSAGLAVTAQPDGLATDVAVVTDTSRLTPAERSALQASTTPNRALDWVPADAAGLLAVGGLHDSLQSLLQGVASGARATGLDLSGPLHDLGLSDPHGVLSHLTGDLALEVRAGGASTIPGGALLVGTDDAAAVRSFLDQLVGGFAALAPAHTETYRGAVITSLAIPGLSGAGFAPAYAVSDGMAVLGSGPAEVRAVLDAHASGARLTSTPRFTAGGGWSVADPVLYLDLDRIRAAVVTALPDDLKHSYDTDLRPDLEHLHGLRITAQGSADRVTERIFLAAG
ncbi:MAG TPA: DUF3352 domain-containing protein [Candidatus Dormibacteraeota bacterium]